MTSAGIQAMPIAPNERKETLQRMCVCENVLFDLFKNVKKRCFIHINNKNSIIKPEITPRLNTKMKPMIQTVNLALHFRPSSPKHLDIKFRINNFIWQLNRWIRRFRYCIFYPNYNYFNRKKRKLDNYSGLHSFGDCCCCDCGCVYKGIPMNFGISSDRPAPEVLLRCAVLFTDGLRNGIGAAFGLW